MLILPAIDLLDGRVVRLHRGRFDRVTAYSDDPLAVARRWRAAGATALHIVDLDGARSGRPGNLDWIYRIRADAPTDVIVHAGGGIRTFALASRLLGSGVDRVVLGTAALGGPGLLEKLLRSFAPDRLVVALDVEEGELRVEGWESGTDRTLDEVPAVLERLGIEWVACTDISRDGTLRGPGLDLARRLIGHGLRVIVAGGIRSTGDIEALRSIGAAGCIVGSALYEGVLPLDAALEAAGHRPEADDAC